ncbi:MAG: NADPH:quinone oxidoreductase family protein [Polyangiales bacterium]
MYRMIVRTLDGPAALEMEEADRPEIGRGEVGIDVHAIGCNFFDTLITEGKYQVQPELPFAPGAEAAGVVEAVGEGVVGFSPGDRVSALLSHGAYASVIAAPQERVFSIPDRVSFEQAAATGLVYQTSHVALVHRANLQQGDTLLVHAAAGGVGLAAVQIGAALGARVIGTAGTKAKLDLILENGADVALNYRDADWVTKVKELTDGRGADVIYDPVGGDTFDASTKCIAFEGRLLVVGFASGRIPTAAMNRVLVKNFSLVGIHWGLYFEKDPQILRDSQEALSKMLAAGQIKPLVSKTYSLRDAKDALDALASRNTIGKVVLIP